MPPNSSSLRRRLSGTIADRHTVLPSLRISKRFSSLSADIARFAPLAATLVAPASTLFDIPALTQRWYSLDGVAQPDPRASLILSGCGLAASLVANALLVARFTIYAPKVWRMAIILSTAGWVLKTALSVANLITFGALSRNAPGYAYEAGFWTAVISVVLAGIVSGLLLFHVFFRTNDAPQGEIQFHGRTFISSELTLFALIALEALIFSRIEGWTYLEGLYFTVVSMLSIGFGDFSPTHASTKVLLFPFEIVGIVLLSNQISLIIGVVKWRVEERRKAWYESSGEALEEVYERKRLRRKKQPSPQGREHLSIEEAEARNHSKRRELELGLTEEVDEDTRELRVEIARLHRLASHEAAMSQLLDLLWSAAVLVLFWVVGAIMFHFMEVSTHVDGWTMGDSFYFSYVFFLTIGYGDFSPVTSVGQSVFIIWALMAVPIMTNFVVTTIQAVVERMSKLLALTAHEKRKERQRIVDSYFESHDRYLSSAYAAFQEGYTADVNEREELQRSSGNQNGQLREAYPASPERTNQNGKYELALQLPKSIVGTAGSTTEREETSCSSQLPVEYIRLQTEALRHALSLATYMEAQGRSLLVEALPESSPERLLLQADANVQALRLTELEGQVPAWMEKLKKSIAQDERLDRVKIYRMTYARLLVAGRRALNLGGQRADAWERRPFVVDRDGPRNTMGAAEMQ